MARFKTSTPSVRSAEDAFDYLADMRNASMWDPGVSGATLTHEGQAGVVSRDTTFDVTLRLAGRARHVTYRLAAYDRPRLVVLEANDPAFHSADTVSIESLPDGTSRVSYDAILEPLGVWKWASPLIALAFDRIGRRAATGLAREMGR